MDLGCSEAAAGILRVRLCWGVSSSSSSKWFRMTHTLIHVDIEDFVRLLGRGQGLQRVLQIDPAPQDPRWCCWREADVDILDEVCDRCIHIIKETGLGKACDGYAMSMC